MGETQVGQHWKRAREWHRKFGSDALEQAKRRIANLRQEGKSADADDFQGVVEKVIILHHQAESGNGE